MRFFTKKAVFLLIAVVAVFLLTVSAARGNLPFPISEKIVVTVLTPLENAASGIGDQFRRAKRFAWDVMTVYQQNEQLKQENDELRQNILQNKEVLAENVRLRSLLEYKNQAAQFDLRTARVIARDPSGWTGVILINLGTADGIAKDMPVVTARGMVGSITRVFSHSARVRMITDPRGAAGALVQRPESRVAGIVTGSADGRGLLQMINIPRDADVVQGDQIISSGMGGIYPKGLAIGRVETVENEEGGLLKRALLKPAVDFNRLEEVLVIVRSRETPPAAPPPTGGE